MKKKTGTPLKLVTDNCVTCKRNKSLIVSDLTIAAGGLGDFLKHLGKVAKNIINNPDRAPEIAANIRTAAASKIPKHIAPTAPYILKFVNQKNIYFWIKFIRDTFFNS